MKELIQVQNVKKYYGKKENLTKAIDHITFFVKQQEFVGIMGASGSGKTTLLNLLATIDTVTSGHILYEGIDITRFNEDETADFRKKNLGFVFQDFNLLDTLTIQENISFALSLCSKQGVNIKEKTHDMMEKLGILELASKFPYEVSGGQKQRCACARALINNPKIIFADEPTGALDSKSARVLLTTLSSMNKELGTTILMVTHDAFSASYCDRILFLKDGKIFHELYREDDEQQNFLQKILNVLSMTGGDYYAK
ncbi:MAG: ABC transporter ATP-binding protein [Blautia sp.]